MTGQPTGGDDDPVAQFSDPELRHGYAEVPPSPVPPPQPGAAYPSYGRRGGLGAWSPRRLLLVVIIVIVLGTAALVIGLAH